MIPPSSPSAEIVKTTRHDISQRVKKLNYCILLGFAEPSPSYSGTAARRVVSPGRGHAIEARLRRVSVAPTEAGRCPVQVAIRAGCTESRGGEREGRETWERTLSGTKAKMPFEHPF